MLKELMYTILLGTFLREHGESTYNSTEHVNCKAAVHNRFLQRAVIFFVELKAQSYPNANSLAALCNCSSNTAQRVIYRMRDEHLVPIEYDSSLKGYYLTDPSYDFQRSYPISRKEFFALITSAYMVNNSGFKCLSGYLVRVWNHLSSDNSTHVDAIEETRELMPEVRDTQRVRANIVEILEHASVL